MQFRILAAVMTAFFPCVTFGQVAEVLDGGEMGNFPSLHVDGLVDKKVFNTSPVI